MRALTLASATADRFASLSPAASPSVREPSCRETLHARASSRAVEALDARSAASTKASTPLSLDMSERASLMMAASEASSVRSVWSTSSSSCVSGKRPGGGAPARRPPTVGGEAAGLIQASSLSASASWTQARERTASMAARRSRRGAEAHAGRSGPGESSGSRRQCWALQADKQ